MNMFFSFDFIHPSSGIHLNTMSPLPKAVCQISDKGIHGNNNETDFIDHTSPLLPLRDPAPFRG